jgi:NADP-dependent 3-hydroxy acid dehydrogenase YdfG
MKHTQTWFITGCSAGLGRALTDYLLSKNYNVVATARNLDSLKDLQNLYPDTLLALLLDVHKQDQIDHAVEASLSQFGTVDVVVNNAGYGLVGNFEGMTDAQIRHQFDTNFFGALAVTRAFLPHFRANRKGHFLHISSIAGLNVAPGGSIYSASKFALEGFSEGLAKECADLNIKSICIEPGPFRTDWAGRSLVYAEHDIADYDSTLTPFKSYLAQANGNQKGDPYRAAQTMEAIVAIANPPLRLPLGAAANRVFYKKLDEMKEDTQRFSALTLSADFPETL